MTTIEQTIIHRIQKLQGLTVERGATPEEAAVAAAKIQALLFQYGLEQIDIDQADPLHAPSPVGKVEFAHNANRATITWKRSLLHLIATNNGCKTVFMSGTTKQAVIGTRANIEGCLYLYEVVARQIEALARTATRLVLSGKASYKNSFCLGAASTIGARLREQREQDVAAACAAKPDRYAVALRSADLAVQEASRKFFPHVTTERRNVGNHDGYADGKQAGHTISMHQGVSGRQTAGLLG